MVKNVFVIERCMIISRRKNNKQVRQRWAESSNTNFVRFNFYRVKRICFLNQRFVDFETLRYLNLI